MSKIRLGIIFTAGVSVLLCAHQLRAVGDPWSRNRKFCGRLLIVIAGAGDTDCPLPITKTGKTMDIASVNTWASFLQFRRASAADMPGYSLVMTSDPKLRDVLNQMSPSEKQITGFLGVVPSSIDSFKDLLSADGNVSILQRAISKFSDDKDCKELMKKEGYDSVLPLLKVEIVIDAENSGNQIPLWSAASETGSLEKWYSKKHRSVVDKDLIQQLLKRLDGAAVQTFLGACEAASIGDYFITPSQSACYLSVTDRRTVLSLKGLLAPFGARMGEEGADTISLQRTFSGARNVTAIVPALLSTYFSDYRVSTKNKVGFDPIFAKNRRVNPLQSFAFTSADARAESILQAFIEESIVSDTSQKLLDAGFSESLPSAIQLPPDAVSSDPDLRKVLELTAIIRGSYAPYLSEIKIPANEEFETAITAFRECARRQNPQPSYCSSIFELVDVAGHGTADSGRQTNGDHDLVKSFNDFFDDCDENYQAPSLIARYNRGEITASILFERLGFSWKKFDYFREALTSFESEHHVQKSPPDLQAKAAFKVMIINYQNAFFAVQKQFFPLLLKGTLEVRLARIEEAAKLLHLHKNELPSTLANDELRQLANELACLTYYPVGPAFDKRNSSQSRPVP